MKCCFFFFFFNYMYIFFRGFCVFQLTRFTRLLYPLVSLALTVSVLLTHALIVRELKKNTPGSVNGSVNKKAPSMPAAPF